jgi:uncharacterized membrane protein YqjE
MSTRLLTAKELDAYEKRWKRILFAFLGLLILDLLCLFIAWPSSTMKVGCAVVAAVSIVGGLYCSRKLHNAMGPQSKSDAQSFESDYADLDPGDIASFPDIDD